MNSDKNNTESNTNAKAYSTPEEPARAAPQATPPQKGFPTSTTTRDPRPNDEKSDMPFDPEAKAPYRSVYLWATVIIVALIVLYLIFR